MACGCRLLCHCVDLVSSVGPEKAKFSIRLRESLMLRHFQYSCHYDSLTSSRLLLPKNLARAGERRGARRPQVLGLVALCDAGTATAKRSPRHAACELLLDGYTLSRILPGARIFPDPRGSAAARPHAGSCRYLLAAKT